MRHTLEINNSFSMKEYRSRHKRSDNLQKISKQLGVLGDWMNDAFYFFDAVYWYADFSDEEIASMAADGFEVNE